MPPPKDPAKYEDWLWKNRKSTKEEWMNCKCEYCGELFHLKPNLIGKSKHNFCCMPCKNEWQKTGFIGENNPFYNKTHTPEARKKQGVGKIGIARSEESKQKQSEATKGKPKPEDWKQFMSKLKKNDPINTAQLKQMGYNQRGKPKSDVARKNMSIAAINKPKSYDFRLMITECNLGGLWYGSVTYSEYIACPKLTLPMKQWVRDYFGCCAWCGDIPEKNIDKNGRVMGLIVHHVFEEPQAFCNSDKNRMETIRKMMPQDVARFDAPEYSDEELWYVRLLVPLCHRCHGTLTKSGESNKPYDETIYRKYFCELVKSNYNGICYVNHKIK